MEALINQDMQKGLLNNLLANTPLAGSGVQPRIEGQNLIVEMNEEQLSTFLFKSQDARFKGVAKVKLETGKMVLTIRLL